MFEERRRGPAYINAGETAMQILYAEIGVIPQSDASSLLVVELRGPAVVQTKHHGPLYLPNDAQLVCILDGPSNAWAQTMQRLNQVTLRTFDYGESLYLIEDALARWVAGEKSKLDTTEDPPF